MNHRILIVEDEAKLREVLCDYFRSRGELPAQAADGAQALGMLEEDEFDAVLLDILMPGLDGLSVCRAVRRTSGVPIVFLTALSAEEDKLLGYELGADDYVTKPFSMSVLYAKVSALIRRSRGNMLAGDVLEDGGVRLVLSRAEGVCLRTGACAHPEGVCPAALPDAEPEHRDEPRAASRQVLGL